MRRLVLFATLLLSAAVPAFAQGTAVGISVGVSQQYEGNLDFDGFDDQLKEIFLSTELEPSTVVKLKAGEIETDDGLRIGAPGITDEGTIQYAVAVVEYRFWEVFGSTSLFAGAGGYRQKFGSYDETDIGVNAGVNAIFPVTRRMGVTAELGYHWMNFENERRLVTAGIGLRYQF